MKQAKKDLLRKAGFGREVKAVEAGRCPFCKQPVNPNLSEFHDMLSRKEYSISGLCQSCQDETFSP